MISFSVPEAIAAYWAPAAVLLLAGLAWLLGRLERCRNRRLHGFAETGLLARLVSGYAPGLRRPLNAMVLLGSALLVLAAAGPHWGSKEFSERRGSREILVLLDTSESMNAANPAPSRMARARNKIGTLLETYSADRFGLIAFSGAAALQCPLTRDRAYFKSVLDSVTTDTLAAEGTDIEAAFDEAAKLFVEEQGRGRGSVRSDRIILLISDGEEVSGNAVAAAGRLARHARVAVLGIGDPEGAEVTLPQWMQRSHYGTGNAQSHWSVLDEENLAAIARAGGGVYVRSTLSGDDLAVIGRELAALDGYRGTGDPTYRKVNRYRWPLAGAALCFAAEGLWLVLLPSLARARNQRDEPEEARHALV